MYLPPAFEVTDRAWIAELIARHPFALLVTGEAYPRASHLPIVAQASDDGLRLVGHVAAANPHAESIRQGAPATIVFEGAHAYVSASWYERPYETVPTWNYTAVHVAGRLRECDARDALQLLIDRVEGDEPGAWDPANLDPDYLANQIRGIVAFELRAERVLAKAKLSQNRTESDRRRVIAKLVASSDQTERECGEAMLGGPP
ncbi:MAG TPA: FMN-binding negative transcriptional regulator [Candidatus Binatia bacterium]|nr:FMN-binding negative transcriptional regulator [Candidatus Binatia bacterium]